MILNTPSFNKPLSNLMITYMLARTLKTTREFHRLKQFELAKSLGISPSYLSEIEAGIKQPSLDLIQKYGEVFKIAPSTFLLFEERTQQSHSEIYSQKNSERLLKFLEWVIEEDDDCCPSDTSQEFHDNAQEAPA